MHVVEPKESRPLFGWAAPALIALLVALAYGAAARNGFVWDDGTFIVENPSVHDLSLWPKFFTKAETVASGQDPTYYRVYRPVQTLSFALDAALWGDWAGGYHLTSLLIHMAASWAVIFAFGPLVGRRAAVLAAVVFAVHPALSEGVLCASARGGQLYTLFGLLSIGWFVRVERPFDRWHFLSLAAAIFSFFSKEPAIVLVALLPLLQAVFGRPGGLRDRSSILLHAPFLLAAGLYLVARMMVVDTSSVVPYWGGSLGRTLLMQSKVFVTYLRLLVWPFPLLGRYPVPYSDPLVVLHVLINVVLVAVGVALFLRGGKARLFALAIAWFYVSLAPVSNIIPLPGNMAGERFLYFTFAGMFPLFAATVADSVPQRFTRTAAVSFLCVLFLFIVADVKRTGDWRDNRRFFALLSEQVPEDPLVQTLMAREEVLVGNPASAVRRMAPIIGSLSSYTPAEKAASYYWYGRALLETDRPREAFDQFAMLPLLTKSLPAEVIPYVVEASARSGNLAFATSLLEQELRRTPNNDVLWNDLGNVLAMRGDGRSAVMAYERAVMINPGNQEAAVNLLRARQTAKKTGR